MVWYQAAYEIFVVNLAAILLEVGLAIYLYRILRILKGGILARGMLILATSPVFMILSALGDALSELGYEEIFEIAHDLFRIAFILLLFLGFRSIVTAWRKFTK